MADGLRIVYLLFIIIRHCTSFAPATEIAISGKQIWQILLLMLTEDEQTYHMSSPGLGKTVRTDEEMAVK